jgi:hypothetical protein
LLFWKGNLALEDYVREARAHARALRAQADSIDKHLKELLRLEPTTASSVHSVNGQFLRKPDGWNVADDIKRLLKAGEKSVPRQELIKTLVENDLVKGTTPSIRIAAARRAITMGEVKGYLRIEDELVHWVPHVYENPRLRKNI